MLLFYTQRLSCKPLTLEDSDEYCALYSDANVMRNIAAPCTRQQAEKNFNTCLTRNHQQPYTQLTWTICHKDTQQFIGIQGLIRRVIQPEQAEVGIMLIQQAFNQGIATEAIAALLQFSFTELQLKCVFAHFHPTNKAVEIIARKLGFTIEDDVRQTQLGLTKYCFIEKKHLPTK